jgi:hypothetical protein
MCARVRTAVWWRSKNENVDVAGAADVAGWRRVSSRAQSACKLFKSLCRTWPAPMMVGLSPALSGPNASAYILLSLCIVSTVQPRLSLRCGFSATNLVFCFPSLAHSRHPSVARHPAKQGLLFCLRGYHYRAFVSFMCAAAIAGASAYFVLTLNIGSSRRCLEQSLDTWQRTISSTCFPGAVASFLFSFFPYVSAWFSFPLPPRNLALLCQMPSPFRS